MMTPRRNAFSVPKQDLLMVGFAALALLAPAARLNAQGCIVARSSSMTSGPETQGGYLMPGEWDITVGYRHQFSFRHFVGPTEQKQRLALGTQIMNKVNLENLNVVYQATPRFSLSFDMPLLLASRRGNTSAYTPTAQGIGDTIVTAQGWIWNPSENSRGNV